jgi:hypothetical protein
MQEKKKAKNENIKCDKVRCNLYFPVDILEEVDRLGKMYGASRGVMMTFMLKTYIDQQKMVDLAKALPRPDEDNTSL